MVVVYDSLRSTFGVCLLLPDLGVLCPQEELERPSFVSVRVLERTVQLHAGFNAHFPFAMLQSCPPRPSGDAQTKHMNSHEAQR